jgi:hypothetical protein
VHGSGCKKEFLHGTQKKNCCKTSVKVREEVLRVSVCVCERKKEVAIKGELSELRS